MSTIPGHVVDRIRRRRPEGWSIVVGSTPVISFGPARSARVATLGLNPSKQEFLDRTGAELVEQSRRFQTLRSLGVADLDAAPENLIDRVVTACDRYFSVNPYRAWFNQLEPILNGVGTSYYDGTSCHLDLVQWATDPTWGGLSDAIKRHHVSSDVPFLRSQLADSRLELLLLNGKAVMDAFSEFVKPLGSIHMHGSTRFGTADLDDVRVIGWSTNIQSSYGVTVDVRRSIASHAADLASSG